MGDQPTTVGRAEPRLCTQEPPSGAPDSPGLCADWACVDIGSIPVGVDGQVKMARSPALTGSGAGPPEWRYQQLSEVPRVQGPVLQCLPCVSRGSVTFLGLKLALLPVCAAPREASLDLS